MKDYGLDMAGRPRGEQPYILSFRKERDLGKRVRRKKLTLDQFASLEYIPYIRKSIKSWAVSEHILRRHISPVFGHRQLCGIKRSEVRAWLDGMLKQGLTVSTCNRQFATLRALCSHAEYLGYIPLGLSPCYKVSRFPQNKPEPRIVPPEKLAEVMAALKQSGHAMAKAIRLIHLTSSRKNEILKAQWKDIDWKGKKLRSARHNPGKTRWIDLPQEAIEMLTEMRATAESEWIFPGKKPGTPVSDIYQFWNRTRKALGLPQLKIEDLRFNNRPPLS